MSSYRPRDNAPDRQGHPVAASEEHPGSDAARFWHDRMSPGMYVIDRDGRELGQVKEVRAADFLLDRSNASAEPVYIPFAHVGKMLADRVTLDVDAAALAEAATPLAGFGRLAER